ncbi:MAG: family 10 glycosylhydrolase [Clostridia bacterium]|nr:family 10 glycosylhydrolase [Clostridia bacterium]
MKKLVFFLILFFLPAFFLSAHAGAATTGEAEPPALRGVWVSTVYNLDYPSRTGLSQKELIQEADAVIANCIALRLNAVFLQVRPCADSLFPSEVFPWSSCLSGVQGQAPDGGFDPLAYFIRQCHANGLELHCWINPYRVTRKSADSKEAALAQLAPEHPARKAPELTVWHSDGCLYFDPGLPEAQALILEGICEILDNYEIDGIHFDDYFYPGGDFDDTDTYSRYGSGYASPEDFRRASVTALIRAVHDCIGTSGKEISFGISPFGIWANDTSMPAGSATVGSQSYFDHYADSRAWVQDGLVDYIAPQLYWAVGNREGEFKTLLAWWKDCVADTGVQLYIGLAAYRLTDAQPDSDWYGITNLKEQLSLMAEYGVDGALFFRYSSICDHGPLRSLLQSCFSAGDSSTALWLETLPALYSTEITLELHGYADPSYPLYVNNVSYPLEAADGSFALYLPLSMGGNTYWLSNGKEEICLTVYRQLTAANRRRDIADSLPDINNSSPYSIGCFGPADAVICAFTNAGAARLKDDGSGFYTTDHGPDYIGHVLYTCEKNGVLTVDISLGSKS